MMQNLGKQQFVKDIRRCMKWLGAIYRSRTGTGTTFLPETVCWKLSVDRKFGLSSAQYMASCAGINKVETLRTFDGDAKTAREIAIENHNELLTPLLEPTVLHPVPPEKLARLQLKLHTLMHEVAGEYVSPHPRIGTNGQRA